MFAFTELETCKVVIQLLRIWNCNIFILNLRKLKTSSPWNLKIAPNPLVKKRVLVHNSLNTFISYFLIKENLALKNILTHQSQTSLKVMLKVKVMKLVLYKSWGRLSKITIKNSFKISQLVFEFLWKLCTYTRLFLDFWN